MLGRRTVLKGVGAAALASAVPAVFAGDKNALFDAYIKLRGGAEKGLYVWWYKLVQSGMIDGKETPLFVTEGCNFMSMEPLPDGNYAATAREMSFLFDLDGNALKEFTNPYTGETLKAHTGTFGPNTVTLSPEGMIPPTDLGGRKIDVTARLGPLMQNGDDIWIQDTVLATVAPITEVGKPFIANDYVTYKGKAADVAAGGFVPATIDLVSDIGWPFWLKMGNRDGRLIGRGVGKKLTGKDTLPDHFKALARKHYPVHFANPENWPAYGGVSG